ncbi:DUF1642 domain-containing protein [Enterococcus faecium]|uniref:DUF1642 domain-containing protein n=1 Tax=Enterococcus faecium TaxID=1352 RepID=UPI00391CDECA
MNKKVLIDKQALIDELMKIPGVGSNSDALETIKRFPSYKPKKSVVPKFVADWIEYAKKKGDSLAISFKPWNLYGVEYSKADRWIEDNQETFARAWIDGYEVEKEPLYYVRLPYEVWDEEAAELKTEYLYLHYEITSDETRIFPTKEPRKGFVAKLDELTIKSADENYWPFAVPVEEVVEG